MYNYPNPCEICQTENCTNKGCNEWRMRFLTIWKQFNSYVQRQYRRGNKTEKFGYEHPDLLRKYLREGPCKGCKIEENCDTPCGAYYNWWDARMAWLKWRCEHGLR